MSSPLTRLFRLRSPVAILAICFIGLITIPSLYLLNSKSNFSLKQQEQQQQQRAAGGSYERTPNNPILVDPTLNDGGVIMPKLGNATAKAELGRATWKLLHTMASRYPEKPKGDERAAVKQWIFLLSRLYPCGECADHFQLILKDHPPQTSSRAALSNWACSIHNIVNTRLGKAEFDCSTLENVYQCGCAEDPAEGKSDFDPLQASPDPLQASPDGSNVDVQIDRSPLN